eukprot:9471900-Pyramimonas_sp.AAC.1
MSTMSPMSPLSPLSLVSPMSPMKEPYDPMSPMSPVSPVSPMSPMSPRSPRRPMSPMTDAAHIRYHVGSRALRQRSHRQVLGRKHNHHHHYHDHHHHQHHDLRGSKGVSGGGGRARQKSTRNRQKQPNISRNLWEPLGAQDVTPEGADNFPYFLPFTPSRYATVPGTAEGVFSRPPPHPPPPSTPPPPCWVTPARGPVCLYKAASLTTGLPLSGPITPSVYTQPGAWHSF